MRRPAMLIAGLLAAALPARADAPELVGDIQAATISRAGPQAITICARATVPTGGYTQPKLAPAGSKGAAGVYDLDFTAVRPAGMATQMVSQISASFTWRGYPADLKAVRVRGDHDALTAVAGSQGHC